MSKSDAAATRADVEEIVGAATKQSLTAVGNQIEAVNDRIDELDDKLSSKIDRFERKVDQVLDDHGVRISKLEKQQA